MFSRSAPVTDIVEPDFTVSGSRDWERKLTPEEKRGSVYDKGHRYYHSYVYPDAKDKAACEPDWPLAAYWPVYLSNFLVAEWDLPDTWYHQVSDFFASKGLLTRMMYFPVAYDEPPEYARMMKRSSLIEGLVYFCSKRDAKQAIANCHRALYYGHRINVLPGRVPEYFANKRSIRFIKTSNNAERKDETTLENRLNPFGEVEFITRHSVGNIIVQFKTPAGMLNALSNQVYWKPIALKDQTRKQRFLEADMKSYIRQLVTTEPGFMDQKPRPEVMQFFTDGIRPIVETTWKITDNPLVPKYAAIKSKQIAKRKARLQLRRTELSEKAALPQPTVKGPRRKTPAQHRADVLKSINWFLRTNKKPMMTVKAAKALVRDQKVARRLANRLNS